MKKTIASLVLFLASSTAVSVWAQGTVDFLNSSQTLISYRPGGWGTPAVTLPNVRGTFYFALLTAPPGSTDLTQFSFSGAPYATNLSTSGIIFGRNGVSIPGWIPGTYRSFVVAGWSADNGPAWNEQWLTVRPPMGYFGISAIGENFAGGVDPVTGGPIPAFTPFGPLPNITHGWVLEPVTAPALSIVKSDSASGSDLLLSWSIAPQPYVLQENAGLSGADWADATASQSTNLATQRIEVTLPIPPSARFYRLNGIATQSNIFSTNIVGCATLNVSPGYSLMANPLSAGVTNGANEIMPLIDGEKFLTWDGARYDFYLYSSVLGGWVDSDLDPANPPSLPPGKGFFFSNPSTATNITFVGEVVPGPHRTNCLSPGPGYSLLGSPLPASVTNISSAPVSLPLIDGMVLFMWNRSSGFSYLMWSTYFRGWVDEALLPTSAPSYEIGQGFFMYSPVADWSWCQSLP